MTPLHVCEALTTVRLVLAGVVTAGCVFECLWGCVAGLVGVGGIFGYRASEMGLPLGEPISLLRMVRHQESNQKISHCFKYIYHAIKFSSTS